MHPKFYVENKTDIEMPNTSTSSDSSPPIKRLSEPLDLSSNSAKTVETLSSYSRAGSSLDNSYSLEKRDPTLPDFVFFGNESNHTVGFDGNLATPYNPYLQPISLIPAVNTQRDEKFQMFRLEMLKHLQISRDGELIKSNSNMRRRQRTKVKADGDSTTDSSSNDVKDSTYHEKRAKNNAAAKKSRDRRKFKEYETTIRASYLEKINRELRVELAKARNEIDALKIELKEIHDKHQ